MILWGNGESVLGGESEVQFLRRVDVDLVLEGAVQLQFSYWGRDCGVDL